MLVALREYASLCYWWTLFHLNSLFLRFVYTITPLSVLKEKIIDISATVGIKLTCDVSEFGKKLDKSKYTVEVLVKDDRFFYKIFDATLGIGEAYMVCTTQEQTIHQKWKKYTHTMFFFAFLHHPLLPAFAHTRME
jgi:hypothetical protein